jgi:hypothetical protein
MIRNCLLFSLTFVLLLAAVSGRTEASPLDADVMKAALRTATPEEDGFINRVLMLVDRGKLPLDMVESTFLWARKRPQRKFQYFKWALTYRAQQQGIKI